MPPFYIHLHGRDTTSADADTDSIAPGQRVSIDGGIDSSRNIIAMILATVLFIVVVVLYQYLTIMMARREQEAKTKPTAGHKRRKSQSEVPLSRRLLALIKGWISFFKLVVSPPNKPTTSVSSTNSMEALLKVTPRRPPKRRTFPVIPCLSRQKQPPKSKREIRQALRPLLLHHGTSSLGYIPRSPIDEKTYELLRSPDAFAEFSDPVRNMNFVRFHAEVQRRKERDEIWYEEPREAPERPGAACVAPLAIRRKKKDRVLREGEDPENEWAPPSPERVIYPSREPVAPAAPVASSAHNAHSLTYYPPYSPRHLSIIDEETEPPTPRSFFEISDDEEDKPKVQSHRKKIRLRFPLPSPAKASFQKDVDVFTIGSFSASEDSYDGSEPGELERQL